jgi:hypothetical protein
VHRSACLVVLSAAAIAAALGLGGCSRGVEIPPTTPVTLTPPPVLPEAQDIPLPPPEALVDVMVRLTDSNVPAADRLNLIEFSTAADVDAIARFDKAVTDGGYRPLTFEARDIAWSAKPGGAVVTTMVIKTANPQAGEGGNFTFPMEFLLNQGTWQLTRESTDMLLQYAAGTESSPPPAPPVAPLPPPP